MCREDNARTLEQGRGEKNEKTKYMWTLLNIDMDNCTYNTVEPQNKDSLE